MLSSSIKAPQLSRQIKLIHNLFSGLSRFSDSRAPAKERVFIWKIGLPERHAKSSPTFVEVLHTFIYLSPSSGALEEKTNYHLL